MAWAEQDIDQLEEHVKSELAAIRADVDAVKRYMIGILVTLIGVLGALAANLAAGK